MLASDQLIADISAIEEGYFGTFFLIFWFKWPTWCELFFVKGMSKTHPY